MNKKLSVIVVPLIWLSILMAFPFSIPQAYHLPAKPIITLVFVILCTVLGFYINKIKVNESLSIIFLIQLFLTTAYYFLHSDSAYINVFLQIAISLVIYLHLNNFVAYEKFIKRLIQFVLVMGVLGGLAFFLCLIFNFKPIYEFVNPDGRTAYNFLLTFTNAMFDMGSAKIIRPAGFFDEPGTLAFYIIVCILLNDLTKNSNKIRSLLFISGIFTLSVAFYALAVVYFLLRFKVKYFKIITAIFVVVFILLSFLYTSLEKDKQDILYNFTVGRVESIFSSSNNSKSTYFKGDNRTELINLSKEAIKESPVIGIGISYASKPGTVFFGKFMGANLLSIFGMHGLVGGLILSLHVLYYGWICFKTNRFGVEVKSYLIYFLLILQRPDYLGGVLPYVGVILLIKAAESYNKKIINAQNINYNSSL